MRRKTSFTRMKARSYDDFIKFSYLYNVLKETGCFFSQNMFELSLRYFTEAQEATLVEEILDYDLARKIRQHHLLGDDEELDFFEFDEEYFDKPHELLLEIHDKPALGSFIFNIIFKHLGKLGSNAAATEKRSLLKHKLKEMKRLFNLTDEEREIVQILQFIYTNQMVESIFEDLCEHLDIKDSLNNPAKFCRPLSIMSGIPKARLRLALSMDGNLRKMGIVDADNELTPEISHFLAGFSRTPISQYYFTEQHDKTIPLENHIVEKKDRETLLSLITNKRTDQGIHILLYGEPGTGKTAFARSLGNALGLHTYEINILPLKRDGKEDSVDYRIRAFQVCQRMTDPARSLLIVDEADDLLNSIFSFFGFSNRADKGRLNYLLDNSHAVTIWITNHYQGIDSSNLRRFDYSIKFDRPSIAQRRYLWRALLKKYHLSRKAKDCEIERLASSYELSAGSIDTIIKNFAKLKGQNSQGAFPAPDVLENMITSHLRLMKHGRTLPSLKRKVQQNYSLEGLNISGDTKRTLDILQRFNTQWGKDEDGMAIQNLNCLLNGPPGTGKTEFAHFLARKLERRIIERRASDILNPYVGMSEEKIARSFRQAQEDQAILLIDEADSFLARRDNASHSWEITLVNELLTQLENHRGMVICSTNFRELIDSAATRRFGLKLNFDYLRPDGNLVFYRRFFEGFVKRPLNRTEKEEISRIEFLTPGDFKVVYDNFKLLANDKIRNSELIEALKNEVKHKNEKTMRFGFNS